MKELQINIAKDFSDTPGARYKSDGDFSGEEFRQDVLEPKFAKARQKNADLVVNLDGGYGYATSFLEEAFGGLARIFGVENVKQHLHFISNDEVGLVNEILGYIDEANSRSQPK